MKKKYTLLFRCFISIGCIVHFSCSTKIIGRYNVVNNTVILKINNAKLGITVISDEIMQVRYTLADTFSTTKSLFIQSNFSAPHFDVRDSIDKIIVSTPSLKAKVNKITGQVAFFNKNNQPLLKEKENGGRTILPSSFEGYQTHSVQQQFESPADEAQYGLGQHQDRLLDIKGDDLYLYQHNTEVYIPFLVSTKGYGLLWNNLSFTKFNHPDSIVAIPETQLFDKAGAQGGLTLKLFKDDLFKELSQQEMRATRLALEKDAPVKSAIYTGYLLADKTGDYSFYSYADGTFTLKVNDSLLINNWAPYANARDMGFINLKKGTKYKIEVKWQRFSPKNSFQLKWREPSQISETLLWSKAGQEINYYVIGGSNIDQLISGYRTLTGKATILPKWALGFWQCRERYKTQDEVLGIVKEFRNRKLPLDVIIQDWLYWKKDQWGSAVFEPSRYPSPKAMIDTLHQALHTKFMISIWGKFYRNSDNFRKLYTAGYLYPVPLKENLIDFLDFNYSYYDAFNPNARAMYWKQLNDKLFSKGVDAWWMDGSEPELPDHDATPENMAHFMNPTFEGPGVTNLNAYPLEHTKGVFEGSMQAAPDKRVVILTRSAFAGQQKYATVVWSGDIAGEWNNLKASIPAGLGFCMSGMPYWTTDIGGFWVKYKGGNKNKAYKELFTRWYQYGSFCPIFRVHGSNTEREMWFFGDENSETYQTQLKFSKLRYRLMPYIYTLNGMVSVKDYTMMRGLIMDFPADEKVRKITDQFMFGPSLLVNPVTDSGATQRKVYLPKGIGWFDFWTGKYYQGGQNVTAQAALNTIPLYVKAGSIIPFGPDLQYAMEKKADPIELRVYTGQDGSFSLYEDENTNNNYRKGLFSTILFRWKQSVQELSIGERNGNFPGMLKARTINIIFVDANHGNGSLASSKIDSTITYNGNAIIIKNKK